MIWTPVSSTSYFCWLYRASPSLTAKNIINLISPLTIWWCPCVALSVLLLEKGVCYDQHVLLTEVWYSAIIAPSKRRLKKGLDYGVSLQNPSFPFTLDLCVFLIDCYIDFSLGVGLHQGDNKWFISASVTFSYFQGYQLSFMKILSCGNGGNSD